MIGTGTLWATDMIMAYRNCPQPLGINENESAMETNLEQQFHGPKTSTGKEDFLDSDCSVTSCELKAARNELQHTKHQGRKPRKGEMSPQLSDN